MKAQYSKINTNNNNIDENMPEVTDSRVNLISENPYQSTSRITDTSNYAIVNNAKLLLKTLNKHKIAIIGGVCIAGFVGKIISDYLTQSNLENEISNLNNEKLSYQNVTEQLFCFMKDKIINFIRTEDDSRKLNEDFKNFLTTLPEKFQNQINSTINIPCK